MVLWDSRTVHGGVVGWVHSAFLVLSCLASFFTIPRLGLCLLFGVTFQDTVLMRSTRACFTSTNTMHSTSNDSTINSTFKLSLGTIQLLGTVYCPDGTLDWSGFKLLGSNHVRPRSTGIAAAPYDS